MAGFNLKSKSRVLTACGEAHRVAYCRNSPANRWLAAKGIFASTLGWAGVCLSQIVAHIANGCDPDTAALIGSLGRGVGSMDHENWVDLLDHHVDRHSSRTAFVWLRNGEIDEGLLTYGDIREKARCIAAHLKARGWQDRNLLLVYQRGPDFIAAFFGCLAARCIAVPVNMPRSNQRMDRIAAIADDCDAAALLCTADLQETLRTRQLESPAIAGLPIMATDAIPTGDGIGWRSPKIDGRRAAFLQYTSGSTGTPKGVVVSHANLLNNCEALRQGFEIGSDSIYVSWLPLFHDMGLIGQALESIYSAVPCYLMAPVSFLQKPVRWLKAISRFGNVISGGPNFAYDFCCERISDEQAAGLSLGGWRVAFNGSEPLRSQTIEGFSRKFAAAGFKRRAFYPCYGLAESTLFVAGGKVAEPPAMLAVDRLAFQEGRIELPAPEASFQVLVGSGHCRTGELAIVDPASFQRCEDCEIGEIWLRGPSVADGYFERPETTEHVFAAAIAGAATAGGYLRTGDLGFLREGELFVTGRLKEVLIIRGSNYYPQDIEAAASSADPGFNTHGAAAFTVDVGQGEQLVIVQEVDRTTLRNLDSAGLETSIRAAVSSEFGLEARWVVLVGPGSVPRTSSGKIQRLECRRRYLSGELQPLPPTVPSRSTRNEVVAEA